MIILFKRSIARLLALRQPVGAEPIKAEMSIEEAKPIVAQCVKASMSRILGEQHEPLPDCSLEKMLEANRVMEHYSEKKPDGTTSIYMTVAPRGIAALYAFYHFGQDPEALLEAVGYKLIDPDEDD